MRGVFESATNFPRKYKNIFLMILMYCLFSFGASLYWAAIPILSKGYFHLSAFSISLIVALMGLVFMLSDGFAGTFLDSIGYKPGSIIALFFALITSFVSILHPSLWLFVIGIFFFALSWNILNLATNAYILYGVKKREEGRVFGAYGAFYRFAAFASTFLIGYILNWSFEGMGLFFFFIVLASSIILIFSLDPEKRNYEHILIRALRNYSKSPLQLKRGWKAMKEFSPVSWVYTINSFVAAIFGSVLWFIIPLSLATFPSLHISTSSILSVYELGGFVFIWLGGFLADRYSRKKLFLSLLIILFFLSMTLGLFSEPILFLILTFILAAVIDATETPVEAMIAQVDKGHDKDGTIFGFSNFFSDTAFVVGPIASGFLFEKFGLQGVFILLGVIVFLNIIISHNLLRNFDDSKYYSPARKTFSHMRSMRRHRRS